MFTLTPLVAAAASLLISTNALVIPREQSVPSTYAQGYLEPYKVYHIRYLALDCQNKHDTPFFDDCCHPLLATENLHDDRKPECTPSETASSSASAAEPTSTVVPSDGDDDCEDDDESSAADPLPTAVPAPAPPKDDAPDPASVTSDAPASATSDTPASTTDTPVSASSTSKDSQPSSTPKPKPKPAPAPAPPSNNGGGLTGIIGNIFSGGIATFFFQNGVAGNCGTVHSDSDSIVALATPTYANGIHCGKRIKISGNGHTEFATVADSCPTCENAQSIDLSSGLFEKFASQADGIFDVTWGFTE